MAGQIKGITIEFDGNTTKLQKALKDIRSSTKDVDKSLTAVNKSLKMDPSNVTLLTQKQQLLTERVSQTKDKLAQLKDAQAQLDAKGVDENSKEYQELQREIIKTEAELKQFEKEARALANVKLKALSEQFKEVGAKMQETGKTLTTHVTAPIAAVGAASIKAFNEVKDGLNIVAQKTGATGAELEAMQTSARNLAKSIPTDFETAGTAVGELNTRFGLTGDALESLAADYIKFAKVNSVDLNSSIDESQKALSAFGLSASEAPHLLDTLTKAGQLTGASVDTLTRGLIQNATAFQELGLSIDQSVMLMAQMEKSGANSETVMQGLRKALKNAAQDGVPLNEALTDLQDTILNGKDGMDGLTAAYDLFGKSGDQIYGAVKNGTLDFNELASAVEDTGGTLESVFNETLTPAEKFQTTLNSVKDAGYEVGSTIMNILAPYMDKLADKAQKLSDWWAKLSPGMQNFIVKAAMLAAVIGPLLIVFGKIATGIGSIISLVQMASGVIGAAGGVIGGLTAGTLLPIIAVIGLVIAAGVLLYKNWDTIKAKALELKAKIEETFESVKTSIMNVWNAIKTFLATIWDGIKAAAAVAWQAIKMAVLGPILPLVTLLANNWEQIKAAAIAAWNALKATAVSIWNSIKSAALSPIQSLASSLSSAWSSIRSSASAAWNSIKSAMISPIESAKATLQGLINKVKGMFPVNIGKAFNIKLPHVSVGSKSVKVGDKTVSVPTFSIDWYAKGGVFDNPSLIGVGEAGREIVTPEKLLDEKLAESNQKLETLLATMISQNQIMIDELRKSKEIKIDRRVAGRLVNEMVVI